MLTSIIPEYWLVQLKRGYRYQKCRNIASLVLIVQKSKILYSTVGLYRAVQGLKVPELCWEQFLTSASYAEDLVATVRILSRAEGC